MSINLRSISSRSFLLNLTCRHCKDERTSDHTIQQDLATDLTHSDNTFLGTHYGAFHHQEIVIDMSIVMESALYMRRENMKNELKGPSAPLE